jgi:hypothetical protein
MNASKITHVKTMALAQIDKEDILVTVKVHGRGKSVQKILMNAVKITLVKIMADAGIHKEGTLVNVKEDGLGKSVPLI